MAHIIDKIPRCKNCKRLVKMGTDECPPGKGCRKRKRPMPKKQRKRYSKVQIKRWAEVRAKNLPQPDLYWCHGCQSWKGVPEEVYMTVVHYRDGSTGTRVVSPCKECKKKKSKAHRDSLTQEQKTAQYQARTNSLNSDPERMEKHRARVREWSTVKRRENGAKPTKPQIVPKEKMLPVCPDLFMEWLDLSPHVTLKQDARHIYNIRHGRQERLDLAVIDRIMTRANSHHMFIEFERAGWPKTGYRNKLEREAA